MIDIKKIRIIILIFILLLGFTVNSFASFDFTYEDTSYSLPDLPFDTTEHPDYVIIYNYKLDYYQVGYPAEDYQTPFYYQTSINSGGQGFQYWAADDTICNVVGPNSSLNWYYYNTTNSNTEWGEKKITSQNQIKTVNNVACAYLVYSSCNIINEDGLKDEFKSLISLKQEIFSSGCVILKYL